MNIVLFFSLSPFCYSLQGWSANTHVQPVSAGLMRMQKSQTGCVWLLYILMEKLKMTDKAMNTKWKERNPQLETKGDVFRPEYPSLLSMQTHLFRHTWLHTTPPKNLPRY